jgi:PPK2 family polyphosphate:nucleotide phosphotransferase
VSDLPYPDSHSRVPYDGSFRIADSPTAPAADIAESAGKSLKKSVKQLDELQRRFYAADRHALLLIFQGMDTSGKDGTIRAVMRQVNPAGCHVKSFKQPSHEELEHDFLWRTQKHLPERGHVGIFNRSYYEEVLIVRVHPHLLEAQKLVLPEDIDELWQQRYESIRQHEAHLARSGTLILKFFLHLSPQEQRRRFLKRLENPRKHWKFSERDIAEREHWPAYMRAYEDAINATSRPCAPWYAIPADDKPAMRAHVAQIIVATLEALNPDYPEMGKEVLGRLKAARARLNKEAD